MKSIAPIYYCCNIFLKISLIIDVPRCDNEYMIYYEVHIGVEKHWDSSSFTYMHDSELSQGTLVRVSFGRQKKIGSIVKKVKKPTYACKPIESTYSFALNQETAAFMSWLQAYYFATSGQVHSLFFPSYLTVKEKTIVINSPEHSDAPNLTLKQQGAISSINATKAPTVLHGITGSGKTRMYINLIVDQLKKGRNVLLLYPEISLTSQIVNEIQQYAPVVNFHSKLTNAQRSKLWYTVMSSEKPLVVTGPRSSLFLPHKNLGIIIVDEAHESSYKQENDLRYSGIYAAAGLAKAHNAKLLLGSATPPVTETAHILSKGGALVCLHEKAIVSEFDHTISVVDAKKRELFSKHPLLSNKLIDTVTQTLYSKKQILLFINRRGTAKLVLCSSDSCDWQAECRSCDLPLTFHHDTHNLICHTCGRKQQVVRICPVCESETRLQSLGSKAIVEDIQKLFPNAKIGRYDSDTDSADSFHENYDDIKNGSVDILIGTQQLVKGLDLPLLSMVGVLQADLSLHFPDFSSDERTFQLLTQVIGRVGRGHAKSTIIVQTFQPDNPIIQFSTHEDWHAFNEAELIKREKHLLPPYIFYAKLLFRAKSLDKADKLAVACIKSINNESDSVVVEGPVPSFYVKRGDNFYVQLHLKSTSRSSLLRAIEKVPKMTIIDLDPVSLL